MLKFWRRRKQPPRAQRVAPHAEWLEQRLLYSADAASLLGVDTALAPAAEERTLDASFEYTPQAAATLSAADVRAAYALSSLQFEANLGQLGEGVDFAANGVGYGVRLGGGGQAELLLAGSDDPVRLELVNAAAGTPQGQDPVAARSNALVGGAQQWVTDIPNYGSVLYRGVYDGIDVRYYGNQSRLEYDFIVAAGADASQLRLRLHGVDDVRLDADGDLVLAVAGSGRELRFQAPVSYQEGANGREAVESHYAIDDDGTVRIVVGAYDASRQLVVDPVLSHATYFGEAGQETATAVAIGADGAVYVTGQTTSTTGSFGARLPSGSDNTESFVAKFTPDLASLVYATRVGGSAIEIGNGIAVDANGNAIVTGWTRSGDFAVTAGADQATRSGSQLQEAFVYKLNADGNGLVFSTYFGSTGNTDTGASVAVDASGNVYAAGTVSGASDNAFLNKYTATGASVFKLQYGGSGNEAAQGVAVDAAGSIYLAGNTLSTDNVVLNGAQATRPGADDVFLAKYNSAGTLTYATYVGSTKADTATGLAVDNSGRAYVVGRTKDPSSAAFTTTSGAFATTIYAHEIGFLRIYDTNLTGAASLEYSSFIGGSRDANGTVSASIVDSPTGVAVSGGKVAIVGHTTSSDFPTTADAFSRTNTSGDTGFLLVLAPQGGGSKDIVYGSYYGTGLVTGGVAWAGSQVVLVGSTNTASGLSTPDAYRPASSGGGEGVVAVFSGYTNVAPMLSGANNLAAQLEDSAGSGTLVADLLAGKTSDVDPGALAGIAVTAADSANGSWQFSRDGGTSWSAFTTPASGSALLLEADAQTRLRFVATANFVGSTTITFRAWDRTSGTGGTVASIATTGGGSAYSFGQASASVTVTPVNDAPVRTAGTLAPVTVGEGSAAVSLGLGTLGYASGGGSDEAAQALRYVVTGLPGSVGTIQLADGTPVAAGGSYTLAELQNMRFLAGRTGTATFTFNVVDDGGTANGGEDALAQSLTLTVSNVAPVLAGSNPMTQLEDAPGLGTLVSDLVAGQVTDGGGAYGIAVVALPGGNINGTWQYSTDGGTTWLALDGSTFSARLLGPDARIRFQGDAGENINGSIPGFTFRAWDGASGTSGNLATVFFTGGTTAFSSTTTVASLSVTPVNDIPVRYDVGPNVFLPAPADVTVLEGSTSSVSLGLGSLDYIPGYATDEYNSQVLTYAVTGLPSGLGTVYLSDGFTVVSAGTSYTLSQIEAMRFKPAAGVQAGTGYLTWSVKDNAGTANGGVDTLIDQVKIVVQNVAPTLNGFNALPGILEDAQSAGMLVSDFISGKVSDPSNMTGIAVTAADGAGGGWWQYSSNGGTSWASLSAASSTNSVLLQTGGQWRIRFLPAANWNNNLATAGAPSLTFRAWDRSTGIGGGTADTTTNGGSTAFSSSSQTATIGVTPVNDAPVRSDVANNPAPDPLVLLDGSPLTSLGLAGITFGPGGAADEAGQAISPSYTVSSLPSGLGTVYLANGTTQVTLGGIYTLAQVQGMQFLSSGVGALGTENFSFTVKDNGGTANGGVDTSTFTVKVIVNRAPVLSGANSVLTVQEDFGGTGNSPSGQVPSWATPAQRAGISIADIVAGQIVDTTASAQGIAIVAATGSGTWQYTLDGGNTWTNMPAVANNRALLLVADTQAKLRFVPEADWNSNIGTAGITFRAWDQTTGIAGQLGDATYNGGASAYSAATATSIATVTPRNDAPTPLVTPVGGTVQEGAAAVPIIASGSYGPGPATATDEAGQLVTVRFTAPIPSGVQLLMADGVTVVNPNDTTTTYALAQFMGMQFRSAAGAVPGTHTLSFELADNGGVANGGVDRSTHTLTLTVTNKAPVLVGANPMAGILEDSPDNGTLVSQLVAGDVVDPTATRGIAVTAVDNSHGSWQYSRDGGTTWSAFGAASADSARLLLADTATRVRFVPAADWNGTATLAFAAWDGTSGTAGSVANATINGAGTAFSTGTATTSITVAAVNDTPVGGVVGSLTLAEDSGSTSLGLGAVSYAPGGGADEAGQALTFTVAALPAPAFGRITLADGTDVTLRSYTIGELRGMRFVAAANAAGTGSFTFNVRDDGGGSDTLAQTVSITVTPVNDAPVAGFDVLAGPEDQPLAIAPATLLANDADVDGDALSITGLASGTGGTVAWSGGTIMFTPDADFNGVGSFSYTVADGNGGTSITGVVVNLAPVNDAPRPAADTVSGTEDQVLTIAPATLLGNDAEVDGDALTITGVAAGAGGTVELSGGNIVFTPTADFNGAGSFTYTVSDPFGATATATVAVDVAPVNDAPVARPETLATPEDTALSIAPATLLANDTDIDGDTLTITGLANGTGGSVAWSGGNIVFTPAADFNGAGSFSYTASDASGATSSTTVTVNVTPVNDAPIARDDAVTATAGIALDIAPATLLGNDTDVEGNPLTLTGVGNAVNGTVTMLGGNIVFVALPLFTGPASFTYTVSDDSGATATATVSVNVVLGNAAPVAGADSQSTAEDTPSVIDASVLLANDTDANGDTLVITGVSPVTGGTVSLAGSTITFTPTADFNGAGRFTYTVSDGRGATSTGTVTVDVTAVNDAPAASADVVAGSEDQVLTIAPATLLGNDRDAEGDALSITAVTAVTGGTVRIAGGNIVFTPDADFNGAASFRYTVSDGQATGIGNVTVNVAPVNDAPVAASDSATGTEDQALTITSATLLANDTDVEADALTILGVANGTGGTVVLSGTDVVFTPGANFNGTGSFSYTVSDGHGGTSTVAVSVTVTPVNDAPVANADAASGTEDQVLTIAPATLLVNDSDIDGDTLSVASVTSGTGGTVALSGGNIVFTPTADFNGAASFGYSVSDGKGGTANGVVTVNVAAVNDAPVARPDSVGATEDQPLTIASATLTGNDTDAEGDALSVIGLANAVGGTLALSGTDILFTPTADFYGAGSFRYTVSDGHGGTSTATVTVSVTPVNDPPVARDDAAATQEDTPLVIAPSALLANDSDVETDALAIVAVSNGSGGTVALSGGNVVFTPGANFNGTGSFGYTVSDGHGGTATATVAVSVAPVNDAPVANPDAVTGPEDGLVVIAPETLLGNDTDAENDSLAITGVGGASGGTVGFSGSSIVFTPNADFHGAGSFTYTIADGHGGTATGNVTVNITSVNDAPVGHADVVGASEDVPLTIVPATLLGNDTDVEGDVLAIGSVGNATGGTVAISAGNIVFTPEANFNGAASFTYTVVDGQGGTGTATVTVNVAPVNDAPVANGEALATDEDVPLVLLPATLLQNDTDVDGNALTIVGVSSGAGGVVELTGGNVVFTPDRDFNGNASFRYTVSDGNGGTATATATVSVAAVNDAPVANGDAFTVTEDTPLTIAPAALLGNDSDVENDALAFTGVTNGAGGSVALSGGSIVFTPDADFTGAATFGYAVSDGNGGVASGTVTIDVLAVNDAPVAQDATPATPEDTQLVASVVATDVDNASLTYSLASGPSHGALTFNADGSYIYAPVGDYFGADSFTYRASDGTLDSNVATVSIGVAAVDDAPVAADASAAVDEDTVLVASVAATDIDSASLGYVLVTGPTHGTIALAADGSYTYRADANWSGADSFRFKANDGTLDSNVATVGIVVAAVNDAPVAADANATVDEDTLLVASVGATDVDSASLGYTLVTGPAHGTIAFAADGSYTYRADANWSGADSFTFRANDGALDSNVATVSIGVRAVNDAPVAQDANAGGTEDTPLAASVAATDVDNASLTYTLVSGPAHGVLTFNADGSYSYRADANYFGADSFSFKASDGALDSYVATVSIGVAAVNDAPVAQGASAAATEDTALAASVVATDVDNASLTYTLVGGPAHGALTFNADGSYSYRADANYFGADSFSFKASDGAVDSSVATVSIGVAAVNDAPVAQDASAAATEDTALAASVVATDVENAGLTYTLVSGPAHGALTFNADGSYSYRADANYFGADSFRFKASDGVADSNTGTVSITVAAVNDAPVAQDGSATTPEDTPLVATVAASDLDNASLTYTLVSGPTHGALTFNADGSYSYQADANYFGADSFIFKANDGAADSNTATVSIAVGAVNDAPVAQDAAAAATEDTQFTGSVAATDVDDASLTYTLVSGPTHGALTFNADGSYSYQADANYFGADSFSFKANDGAADSNAGTVTITAAAVNDAPVAQDLDAAAMEDTALAASVVATDVDNASLTYTLVSGPAHGVLAFNGDGSYSYRADADYFGTDSFSFKASDAAADSNTGTVSITVAAVNDTPVAQDASAAATEDAQLVANVVASDVENATLTYTLVSGPAHGALTFNADGSYSYRADANYFGADTFSFKASDGAADSNSATVRISVAAVNDAPVAQDATAAATEDIQFAGSVAATDVDTASLTYTVISGPAHGTLTFNADGSYSYRGDANYFGADSFSFKANDGAADSSAASVSITVAAVNDAPVAQDATAAATEDTQFTGSVAATDVDNASLTYRLVSGPSHGALTFNTDGSYSYRADANYFGADSFSFKASDGALDSNVATVSIGVAAVNDAPVAQDGSAAATEDTALAASVAATDVDNASLTYTLVSGPAHGVLTFNADGSYSYRADANYFGADGFSFKASDGAAASNTATVSITVAAVNDAPVAQDASAAATEDTPLAASVAATDVDNASLTYSLVSGPAHGALTFNADGSYSYQADANYFGADSFSFKASDGVADSNTGTVSITVAAVNDAPVAQDASPAATEDTTLAASVVATDVDNASLTYTLLNGPAHGALTFNADGSYSYRADANYFGADSFTFKASDGVDDSNTATVSVTVAAVNDAPVTQDATAAATEDTQLVASVVATDVDNASLTFALVSGPAHGALTFNADGSYSYKADANYFGADSFSFRASDGAVDSNTASVSITVSAVNDAPVVQDASAAATEDTALAASVVATDVDNANLTYMLVSGPGHGALTFNADGSYSYLADANYFGADSFSFKASDGVADSNAATVTISVAAVNDAPVAQDATAAVTEDTRFTGSVSATDVDNASLTYAVVSGPSHGALTFNSDGSYSYRADANYFGADSFSFKANDGTLDSNTATVGITVAALNDAPVAQDATAGTTEDTVLAGSVVATDVDNASLTYALVSGPAHGALSFNGDGSYSYHADANYFGADSFVFKASDGGADSNTATVSITIVAVNDAPIAQDATAAATEDTPLAGSVAATDVDNAGLAYTLVSGPAHGALTFNADGSYSYRADADYFGADSFSFKATDGALDSSTATTSITVAAVNDAPVAQDASAATAEDTQLVASVAASDVDSSGLTYTVVSGPTHGALTFNADGSYTYRPDANFFGADSFSFRADDGSLASSVATVSIAVSAVNDAPVAVDSTATTNEDTPLAGTVGATDVEGASLTYALVSGASHGTVAFNADGSYTYRPDADYFGTDSFSFRASDGAADSGAAIVGIAVGPVNDAPVANADSTTTPEDAPLAISTADLLANDSDVDGNVLTVSGVGSAVNGTVTLANGTIVFTPAANVHGQASFTYTVTDGQGGTATASVSVTIAPVNDAPVAAADTLAATEDTPLTIAPATLLANDSDVDGDALVVTSVGSGTGGTVSLVNGSIVFTPAPDFNGVGSFTYAAADGNGGASTALVTVNVAAVDDPAVARPDTLTTAEDTAGSGNVFANDSDIDSALAVASFRLAGDPATYAAGSSVALRGIGTISLQADGSYVYTPVADWNGAVPQLTYTTTTGASGTLTIGVTPVNDTPVATGSLAGVAVEEGATASLGLANAGYRVGGGSDEAANQSLTVTVTATPAALGTITLADGTPVTGNASYTIDQLYGMVFHAAGGASGSSTFAFTVSDGAGGSDTLTQALTVNVANRAPVLDGANPLPDLREDASNDQGMRVADLIAGYASDPGGRIGIAVTHAGGDHGVWQYSLDGIAWSAFDGASASSAQLLTADARIRFVPAADWTGTAGGLSFRAWDLGGGTADAGRADTTVHGGASPFSAVEASASVLVAPVNDAPRAAGDVPTQVSVQESAGATRVQVGDWGYDPGGGSDEAAQVLTITITAVPSADVGTLLLADGVTPVLAGHAYTPEQLRGLQFLAATGSAGHAADFTWRVRDDGGTARGGIDATTGSVRILVVAASATEAMPPAAAAPVPAPPAASSTVPTTPAPPPQAAPAAPVFARPGTAADGVGDALLAAPPPSMPLPPLSEPSFALQRIVGTPETTRTFDATARGLDLQLVGFNLQAAGEFELLGLNGFELSAARLPGEHFQQSLRSGIFIEELNRLRNELRQEFDLDRTLSVSVAGLSLGVSVVYVLWLIRGGVLLGSYLSALPAWRLLDPLPVLARDEGDAEDDDDEAFDPDATQRADPLRGFP